MKVKTLIKALMDVDLESKLVFQVDDKIFDFGWSHCEGIFRLNGGNETVIFWNTEEELK